ncbi:hypothetical protein ACWCXH_36575 [Kitasatospora sp. NPDC001660]
MTLPDTDDSGRRLVVLNRHAISARRSLIVTGPAGTGKTLAVTQPGLAHELHDRSIHPDAHGRIPVLYITVPPAATARRTDRASGAVAGLRRGRAGRLPVGRAVQR